MKQRLRRFMAGFLAMLTVFTTLFSNGTTAFAASASANIAFWNASVKNSGEVSELKSGYNHGKILYAVIDGNAASITQPPTKSSRLTFLRDTASS